MFEGAFYFPTTPLAFSGGSDGSHSAYTFLIAYTVTFSGNAAAYLTVLGQ